MWRREGLPSKARPKWLAGPQVVKDVLRFLWTLDEAEYSHPRVRLQLALSLPIMLYTGLRPGELVESGAHLGSNEGLHWEDVRFMLVSLEGGQRKWRVELRMRFRKHQRGRENMM